MTRVKICGCRRIEDALAAAAAGADFVGVMFAESRRRVGVEEAAEIVRALGPPLLASDVASPPTPAVSGGADDLRAWFEHGAAALERMLARKRPLTVGVFAGSDPDEINDIADESGIDLVQLSGGERWEIGLLANRQVIKSLAIGPEDDVQSATARIRAGSALRRAQGGPLAVLLDRAEAGAYGGTGKALDWGVAAAVAAAMPLWLAGGLTPENVSVAVARVRPWCVDVSSGVETDGVKDAAKIRAFVQAAKGAE